MTISLGFAIIIAMNTASYDFPENLRIGPDLTALLVSAVDALARLDERARTSPLREGWMARLIFEEACAAELAGGNLIHKRDLVLFDAGAKDEAYRLELLSAHVILQAWRGAAAAEDPQRLLRLERPGDEAATAVQAKGSLRPARTWLPEYFYDPNWGGGARLQQWRRILSGSRALPPLLAAAVIWDSWLVIAPEERGSWRAGLLAALTLKARGATQSFLLPVDTGGRFAKYRRHPAHDFHTRIAGFLEWTMMATERAGKDLSSLVLADGLLQQHLKGRRKNSRLPELANLLMSRPLITVGTAARALRCSPQAIEGMLKQLGSVPQELTDRSRHRAWGIV